VRAKSNKGLFEAIRILRDYTRSGKFVPIITSRDFRVARRLLRVTVYNHKSWFGRSGWASRLREIGVEPETLEVFDDIRWAIAEEMMSDSTKHFQIAEFRRRLAIVRMTQREPEKENAPGDEPRRVMLEGFGIELD
jgi:hypothetical protein